MSNLARVFAVKIVVTVAAWCVPLLLFPASMLSWLGFVVPEPIVFLRLLGMAYAALVVCYAFGLRAELGGDDPRPAVWVGVVSNGGACVLLGSVGFIGAWSSWGIFARVFMWASFAGTGLIAAGLVAFGLRRMPRRADIPLRYTSRVIRG